MFSGLLKQYSIDRYARSCAARASMGVVWKADQRPMCDGKNIYLPRISSGTTDEDISDLMHYVAHEVGHYVRTDFKPVSTLPQDGMLLGIANVLDDLRINYHNAEEYAGDRDNDNAYYGRVVPDVLKNLERDPSPEGKMLYGVMSALKNKHSEFAPSLRMVETSPNEFTDKMSKFGQQIDQMMRDGTQLEGTAKVIQLAHDILKEFDPKREEKESKQQRENEQKQKEQEEKEKKKQEAEGKKGNTSKAKGGEGDAEDKTAARPSPKSDLSPASKVQDSVYQDKGKWCPKVKIPEKTGTYIPTPPDRIEVFTRDGPDGQMRSNMRPSIIQKETSKYYSAQSYVNLFGSLSNHNAKSEGLANKVRAKLQILARSRIQYAQKKGKLHGAGLHRLFIEDAGGYRDRVFKKKIDSNILDVSVAILIDTSGSMTGEKFSHAVNATVLLNHVIGNVLQVPTAIYGFTSWADRVDDVYSLSMAEWRNFSDARLSSEKLMTGMFAYGDATFNDNADGEAMLYVYKDLKQQKTKRKVFIMLSDGAPSSLVRQGSVAGFTRDVAKMMEHDRSIECYGIGIISNSIKNFIAKSEVISKPEDLERVLLSLLDKTLIPHN